jgi:hypothetical protein
MADFASPRFADNDELRRILNSPDDGSDKLATGHKSDGVCRVQKALFDLGWAGDVLEPDFVTGFYGPKTTQACLDYKKRYDIHFPPDAPTGTFDGFCGPRTLRSLDAHCILLDEGIAATDAKQVELADLGIDVQPGPMTTIFDATPGTVRPCTIAGADGAIYFRRGLGAFEVHGAIQAAYIDQHGGAEGGLGYPVSDEHEDGPLLRSDFEFGSLRFDPATGLVERLDVAIAGGGLAGDSQRIVVRLHDDVVVPYQDGVEKHLARRPAISAGPGVARQPRFDRSRPLDALTTALRTFPTASSRQSRAEAVQIGGGRIT